MPFFFLETDVIYVDNFIEFYNILHECLHWKIEIKYFQQIFKGYVFFRLVSKNSLF